MRRDRLQEADSELRSAGGHVVPRSVDPVQCTALLLQLSNLSCTSDFERFRRFVRLWNDGELEFLSLFLHCIAVQQIDRSKCNPEQERLVQQQDESGNQPNHEGSKRHARDIRHDGKSCGGDKHHYSAGLAKVVEE